MFPLARPSLHSLDDRQYHCDDLHTLYQWLEAHGYHYFGAFGAESFGRFVCEELALGDTGPIHASSVIDVFRAGTVVAEDTRAQRLLENTATHPPAEGWFPEL